MKRLYPIYLLLATTGILAGCRHQIKTDSAISEEIRRPIDSLNKVVLTAIRERNADLILQLSAEELRKGDSSRIFVRRMMRVLSGLKLANLEVEHQVFSDKLSADSNTHVTFREGTEQAYNFVFNQPGQPTVATFARIPEDYREFGFVTCFSKIRGEWKLTNLRLGLYRIQGMNAIGWYYRAQQQDEAGDLIDAYVQQNIADFTLHPAGENIQYKMAGVIEHQSFAITSRAKNTYSFPIATNPADNAAPRILNASLGCNDKDCVPMFTLLTNAALNDTAALNRESTAVTKNLDQWFPGVSNRNKVIALRMVNDAAFDETNPASFTTMRVPTVADWRY